MARPSADPRPRQAAWLLAPALCGLLALAGCGPDSGGAAGRAGGKVHRIELVPLDSEPVGRDLRPVATLELPDSAEDWGIEADMARLHAGDEGVAAALIVRGDAPRVVRIPLEPETGSFNVAGVLVSAPHAEIVSIQLSRAGKPVIGSPGIWMRGTREPQLLLFELPHTRQHRLPFDELAVRFTGTGEVSSVHRVELLERSIGAFLPDAAAGPAPFEIARTDARSAVGLSSQRALGAAFDVPEHGVLRLSYGISTHLRPPYPGKAKLRLGVDAGGRGRRIDRAVAIDWNVASERWQSMEVPLSRFAGRRVELTLTLDSTHAEEALLAIAEPRVLVPGSHQPTVLLITSDTHRYDHVTAAGRGIDVQTRHIDALAERGVFFANCFSSANSTNPSHVSMLTGRHPRDTGVLDNNTPISSEAPTLARRFAEAGFTTLAALSARHLGHDTSGLGYDFDRMTRSDLSQRRAEETIGELLRWVDELRGEPLFVWLHVFDAHTPYDPPEEFLARHWPKDRDPYDPTLPPLEGVPESVFGPDGWYEGLRDLEFPRAQYRGEVDSLDVQLARVLDHPRLGRGVVALTADHGESLGHHSTYYDHAGVYPDSIHVPLVLAWPGAPAGSRSERPVTLLDLGRTLLDLAGLEDAAFPGKDLTAPLRGGEEPHDEPRFTLAAHGLSCSITLNDWHLVLNIVANAPHSDVKPKARHQIELYHLGRDPECTEDLVREAPEIARRLREQLVRWLQQAEPTGWAQPSVADADTVAQLAELGYTAEVFGQVPSWIRWEPDDCIWCRHFE